MSADTDKPDQEKSPLVIFTVGTAASGKSSWAKAMQKTHPSLQSVILERDMLRFALHEANSEKSFSWSDWNTEWEVEVQRLWEQRILEALKNSDVIILADTHLDAAKLEEEADWLRRQGVSEFTLKYFPALPLTELLRRDQGRGYPVGGEALREHIKKLAPENRYWEAIEQ